MTERKKERKKGRKEGRKEIKYCRVYKECRNNMYETEHGLGKQICKVLTPYMKWYNIS